MAAAPVVITHEGNLRFGALVRGHRILVDQPRHAGGEDTAPTPMELLNVALGSCIALYVRQFCVARGLATEGLRVEVERYALPAMSPAAGQFVVCLRLPTDFPHPYRKVLERVVTSCPVYSTLARGSSVVVDIETEALAAVE